ncbi:MAG: hypothetical protein FD163_151 [Hyphomonadaceae bacterium]|nr:MAG: hypothetical protein FD128_529 [Hyphomonadaceae bacterium]KAF0186876.1 MAG: hypothetical protein FD163_151 [Hyphomonadaceae bacterium]
MMKKVSPMSPVWTKGKMAAPEGLEPPTLHLGNECSILMS